MVLVVGMSQAMLYNVHCTFQFTGTTLLASPLLNLQIQSFHVYNVTAGCFLITNHRNFISLCVCVCTVQTGFYATVVYSMSGLPTTSVKHSLLGELSKLKIVEKGTSNLAPPPV